MRAVLFAPLLVSMFCSLHNRGQSADEKPKIIEKQDVIYGRVEGSGLLADIAYPEGKGPFPAIVSVHGGRWRAGSRTDGSTIKVAQWAELGYFAVSIDYRLVGATPAPACYQDVLCAIRWVHAHAAEYRIDPERVYLIGQSAGAHMVSLVGTLGEGTYKPTGGWDKEKCDVRAVISVAGPYELNALDWGKLWVPLAGDAEAARRLASPIYHVTGKTKPILVIHSDDDKSVPVQQAIDFVQALEKAKVQHRFVHYKDKGHMGITDYVIEEARKFIAEVEKKK